MNEAPRSPGNGQNEDSIAAHKMQIAADIAAGKLSTEEILAARAQIDDLEAGLGDQEVAVKEPEAQAPTSITNTLELRDDERQALSQQLLDPKTPIEHVELIGDIAKRAGPPPERP